MTSSSGHRRAATLDVLLFGLLAIDVATTGPLSHLERRVWRGPGQASGVDRLVSRACERESIFLVLTLLVARRQHGGSELGRPAFRLLGGIAGRAVIAGVVRRRRPPSTWWQTTPRGWSFPSRHTTNALLLTAVLADRARHPDRWAALWPVVALGAGTSRVRLGVHWPSDVVGAVLWTRIWLTLASAVPRELPIGFPAPTSRSRANMPGTVQ